MAQDKIIVRGAKEHNLKNVNVEIPRNKLVVITGLSGSGKSSLAFDTIYAEGQRRYVESLSSYARMFLGQMDKPNVESIECACNINRSENYFKESPFNGRHGYGNLRLSPPFVRKNRCSALYGLRKGNPSADS